MMTHIDTWVVSVQMPHLITSLEKTKTQFASSWITFRSIH